LPPDYAFLAADAGTHAFRANLLAPGGQTLTVTDAGGLSARATVTSTTLPGGSPGQRFVAGAFAVLLGRPADAGALGFFGAALDQGTLTRSQLTQVLTATAEHRALVVQGLYHRLLGRDADPGALSALVPWMAQGLTPEQVEAFLVSSPEYYGRAGGTDSAFVQAAYRDVLGRAADAGGAAYFGGLLAGGAARAAVAQALVFSGEGLAAAVNGLYQGYLGRAADPGGLGFFVPLLQQGVPDAVLVAALVQSDDFFARL
jgi:hypothetical protein